MAIRRIYPDQLREVRVTDRVYLVSDIYRKAGNIATSTQREHMAIAEKAAKGQSNVLDTELIAKIESGQGYTPSTEIDDEFRCMPWTPATVWSGSRLSYFVIQRHPRTAHDDKRSYFMSLDVEEDPIRYIRMLHLYRAAGVCLFPGLYSRAAADWHNASNEATKEKGEILKSWLDPVTSYDKHSYLAVGPIIDTDGKPYLLPLIGFKADSYNYSMAIKRFREVVTRYALKMAFEGLNMVKQEDLPSMLELYKYFINRTARSIPTAILSSETVNVMDETTNALRKRVTSVVPGKEAAFTVDYQVGDSVVSLNPREALLYEWNTALWVIEGTMVKLGARVQDLSGLVDKSKVLPSFKEAYDPYSSPFMIFDATASAVEQAPVFQNVAVNLVRTSAPSTVVMSPDDPGASLKALLNEPQFRTMFERNIRVEGGGSTSLFEQGGMPQRSSIALPLILGLAAGGLAATQL